MQHTGSSIFCKEKIVAIDISFIFMCTSNISMSKSFVKEEGNQSSWTCVQSQML